MRTSAVARLLGTLVSAALLACSGPDSAPPTDHHPNLLLLTVDTLRSDHLSGYGYSRPTSPALDAFFETAVVFDDAHANSAWTLPSLASLLTSLHPSTHGCVNFKSRLDPSFRTLAEILRDAGYRTAGIASHTLLRKVYGLQQGFDSFDEELALNLRLSHLATSSPQVTRKTVDFLGQQSKLADNEKPWFLWAHYFDPHYVYLERPETSEHLASDPQSEDPVDLYDGEIAFTDRQLGTVLDRLEEFGLAESTVVVFTSDHGEAFGEHGHEQHGTNLFREVTQVPLAIRAPGLKARHVATPIEGVDVLPTVLELLGVEPEVADREALAGRSVTAAMRGDEFTNDALLLETELGRGFVAQSLIDGQWKLIADRTGALTRSETGALTLRPRGSDPLEPAWFVFDRHNDPNELLDISADHPEVTKRLREQLDRLLARAKQRGQQARNRARGDLSDEEVDALRALGYLSSDRAD